jgi:hypothetical protein
VRLLLLALAAAASPALASGPACHCFRDRTFDPGRPTAADPYILATTRSSLLSAAFGADKASLVRAVMGGTSPDDLWVAHFAAARAGGDAEALLVAKADRGSWAKALAATPPAKLGAAFVALLANGAPPAALSAAAVDEVLTTRAGADAAAVRALRAAGATTEETILSTVVGAHLGRPAAEVLAPVRAGKQSWGALLTEAGIQPSRLDAIVRQRVR